MTILSVENTHCA